MPRSALLFIPCCCCLFRNSDKSCCCFCCCCCSYFVWVCITTPTNTNDCWHFFKWWKQWMTSSLMSTESFGLFPRKRMCEGCFSRFFSFLFSAKKDFSFAYLNTNKIWINMIWKGVVRLQRTDSHLIEWSKNITQRLREKWIKFVNKSFVIIRARQDENDEEEGMKNCKKYTITFVSKLLIWNV